MFGAEFAVAYVFAWAVRKAKRVGGRADSEVDRALDSGMDRLHDLVSRKLGQDPALERAKEEAAEGRAELSERTRRRLTDSLEEAGERDEHFAALLEKLVDELRSLENAEGIGSAGGDRIDFSGSTFHGPVQGKGTQHNYYGEQPK
ncbi:hypothetical protein ABZ923_00200 [Streptomyces sp. NPDC046881]|uniref:hypothetical protein n=1 Tax=Streptomyces sp. NPDC046881 TaxID=3155374 RepID=UPI00340033EB